jgi:hypothetical protein
MGIRQRACACHAKGHLRAPEHARDACHPRIPLYGKGEIMAEADKAGIFDRLKDILKQYENDLQVVTDSREEYYLNAGIYPKTKKPLYFGSVQIAKNYVSYHLMPLYAFPDLMQNVSADLKKRMQGKSCFNFKKIDEPLFAELEQLTRKGFEIYRENDLLSS